MLRLARLLLWTLPSAILLLATALTYRAYRIPPPERADDATRTAVLATLRGALSGQRIPCAAHGDATAVVATVWVDGHAIHRADGAGADLASAVDDAAAHLPRLSPPALGNARIQVDVVGGRGTLGTSALDAIAIPGLGDMLAINPGIDGIAADVGDRTVRLLPSELVAQKKLLSTKQPSAATPDFAIGIDLEKIRRIVAQRAGVPVEESALYRFRTDAFVEGPHGGPAVSLVRGIPPRRPVTAAALRDAALAGGRYLVAHLGSNGRFVYEHDLATGRRSDPLNLTADYSMPRHAGTTYFLSELYRITKAPWLREPIERAIHHMADLIATGRCTTPEFDCVLDKSETAAQLGSTALGVVALAEYQRATGEARYEPLARRLAAFLLYLQRDDGSFRHGYTPATHTPDETQELLYYSGEASLALARMYAVTGDEIYARAAERGLDWLVGWYDFFLGGFFYGEEHWTCIAAEALWPFAKTDKYRAFCDGYGEFLREQQASADGTDEDDFAGAYMFTPFVPPYNTPAGSRSEAMVSAYLLDLHHDAPDPAIRRQIRDALGYALGQQIAPDGDFDVVGDGDGGIPGSPLERSVRIDYVQHVCSAMIRASEWIDSGD